MFYFIATKLITPSRRKKAILLGSLLLYLSLFVILFKTTYMTLIIYAILIGIAYPIINVPYVSLTYDVIGKARKAKEMRIEYIVVRELFTNIGHVLSISLFLIVMYLYDPEVSIPLLLIVLGAGHLFIYIFIKDIYLSSVESNKNELISDKITDDKNR